MAETQKAYAEDRSFMVDLEPVGRRIRVPAGTDLLSAAQHAGVDLVTVCGGVGICGSCKIRLVQGVLTTITASEREVLDGSQISDGYRLACQASPLSDVRIDVPPESLLVAQKMQVEGQETLVGLDPAVVAVDLELKQPSLDDLRSDFTRLKDGLKAAGYNDELHTDLPRLNELSQQMRKLDWSARAVLYKRETGSDLVAVIPQGNPLLGLAVDIGSTKLALYLVNLDTGATLQQSGVMNPQIAYGEDVVSRIAFANKAPENRKLLQQRLVETLNQVCGELCEQSGFQRQQVMEAVLVGNTAMHHIFCGLPVAQLGTSPYVPATSDPLEFIAGEVGLELAGGAKTYLPANVAGYVGADHTAALLSSAVYRNERTILLVDIGTNTEISLVHHGQIHTCSTASGPAFEGAHIRDGMRAAPGAIENLHIHGDRVQVSTIANSPAVGICGTGILKAISEMLRVGLIDRRGMLNKEDKRVITWEGRPAFQLVPPEASAHQRGIMVTRKDVNEIQLAKGAIRSGIDIMLAEAGIDAQEVDRWIVAGAFGTYLDLESAMLIGMLPKADVRRFRQVGNAAGMGAKQMLLSRQMRRIASEIVRQVHYVELTTYPGFTDIFLERMYF
jgi:uncharacterized 2Fe-2S/4Fe-4S cluster protein (DUF4445 family)